MKMADGTSIDGIDVCRPIHEVSKNTDLQDLSGKRWNAHNYWEDKMWKWRFSFRTMAEMSKAVLQAADKGKMTVLQPEIITLQDIRPNNYKETIVFLNMDLMHMDLPRIYTRIEPIANDSFPEHYFNFVAYNEVQSKADVKDATLTDYIGCTHRISDLIIAGDATRSRMTRQITNTQNLENLHGCIHRNAETGGYSCSVVIPVSSTWVTTRYEGLQLTATPATHYYLNPDISEVHHILSVYANFINPTDALDIQRQPANTDEEEQMTNRFSIHSTSKDNLPTQSSR
ncbi:hypothetical protein Tco_0807224 [Tanacetum coccineum]